MYESIYVPCKIQYLLIRRTVNLSTLLTPTYTIQSHIRVPITEHTHQHYTYTQIPVHTCKCIFHKQDSLLATINVQRIIVNQPTLTP